jgi:hypothetical protein
MSEVADRLNTLKSRLTLMGGEMREVVSPSSDSIASISFCTLVKFKRSVEKFLRNEGHRLSTLNERLNLNAHASCWFKRDLSVIKRLETAFDRSVLWFGALNLDRRVKRLRLTRQALKALKSRLTLGAHTSCWFKRNLSVVKRFKNASALALLFVSGLQSAVALDVYEFTDLSGRKLEAIIVKFNETEVDVQRVSDRRSFTLALEDLSEADQRYLKETYSDVAGETPRPADVLTPGQILTLDFPELGEMAKGKPAQCQLSVPKNYDPMRPVPLLVWFSEGSGSSAAKGAQGLVDYDQFLVLALPYPDGRLPRLAVNAGEDEINAFWDFQRPMLQRVIEMVPNISEEVRIAAGSSSGGHLVGSALDQKWKGFCDYFTGFILHEGGHCPDMKFTGTRSSHRILVIYGESSTAREWQEYFMECFKKARGRIDYIEVPKAGHGINGEGKALIRGWIQDNFGKDLG